MGSFCRCAQPLKRFRNRVATPPKTSGGNALGTLTIGLFWMRPKRFMPVDSISGPYIEAHYGLAMPDEKCGGAEYQEYMKKLDAHLPKDMDYPALAHAAWQEKNQ